MRSESFILTLPGWYFHVGSFIVRSRAEKTHCLLTYSMFRPLNVFRCGEGGQISLWRKRCHIQEEVWLSPLAFFKADSALPRKRGLQSSLSAKKVTPIPFVVTLCRVAFSSRQGVSPETLLENRAVTSASIWKSASRSRERQSVFTLVPSCPLSLSSSSSALGFQCFSIAFNSLETRALRFSQNFVMRSTKDVYKLKFLYIKDFMLIFLK